MDDSVPYEEFVRSQLLQLQDVLVQKHAALLDGTARVKAPFVEHLQPVMCESTTGSEEKYDHKWHLMSAALLGREDDALKEEADDRSQHTLTLHPTWHLSWDHANRAGRERRASRTLLDSETTLRFNDIFTDASFLSRFVVGPDSRLQLIWAGIASVLIIWDMFTIPLELFPLQESAIRVVDGIAFFSFAYWVCDVPLHLVFGLQIGGAIEMRPCVLLRHYFRSWMIMDLLLILVDSMIFSLEIVQAASSNPLFRSGRLVRILRMVRLIRLLRVAKLEREFMLVANHLLSAYTVMALKIVWYLMLMLAVNHLIACCWFGVGSWTSHLGNWLQRANIDETSFAESYVAAMHWSLTQFTPSTNPIAPDNGWERFYAIWVILLAMACFSSFLGSIGSSVNSMRMARNEELMQSAKLERFFMERNLSVELFSKVKGAIRADGLVRIRLLEADVSLMRSIPERLRIQLHTEMFMGTLMAAEMWPSWKHSEDRHFFVGICHSSMTEHVCKLGQDVFLPHAKCTHVYMLQSGFLEYGVHRLAPVQCDADGDYRTLCLPAIWAEWEHVGRLSATAGICNYVSMDCVEVCKLAGSYGGEIFEYLKILGLLIVGRLEDMYEHGEMVTDVFTNQEVNIPDFVSRAENFACLKSAQTQRAGFFSHRSKSQPLDKLGKSQPLDT